MKHTLLILILTLTTTTAHAYDATYNFDGFLNEHQTKILSEIEGRLHQKYDGKVPQSALQNAGLRMLETMNVYQRIQALKIAAACNNDLLSYCRSVPKNSTSIKLCIERRKAVFSRGCNTTLKATLGETLQKNTIIQRVSLPPHTSLTHHIKDDGTTFIASAITTQPISDHGATFATGRIDLGKTGVISGTLHRDAIVQGLPFKATDKPLTFHENGAVESGVLSRDATYQNMIFKAGSTLLLHDNRSIRLGTLAKDVVIKGMEMRAGNRISFTADGHLSSM